MAGSYVEMIVTNTTSIYLSLNNRILIPGQDSKKTKEPEDNRPNLQPVQSDATVSREVSILVQLGHDKFCGAGRTGGIAQVVSHLDPEQKYKVRITHLGGPDARNAILEFEGIWLDRRAKDEAGLPVSTAMQVALLDPFSPDVPTGDASPDKKPGPRAPRPTIEILTSETSIESIPEEGMGERAEEIMNSRVNIWYNQLGKPHAVETVVIPTNNLRLMPSAESTITVQDLFFRSGPTETMHYTRPWSFESYHPSVLILQLGLHDFMDFYSDKSNRKHTLEQFTNDFVEAYVKFIGTIRRTGYPFDTTSLLTGSSMDRQDDGSYVYNSAPSTLPILLIAPFSASRRFVTRKIRLDRVISTALQQVVKVLEEEGDKSTFWIDTTGWLDHKDDFIQPDTDSSTPPQRQAQRLLTQYANFKVGKLLSDHLCTYITGGVKGDGIASATESCPFHRHDDYLGNVYLPQDADFDRAILERKIAKLKEQFNIRRESSELEF